MSTTTLIYLKVIGVWRALMIGLIAILIITSLVFIARAILVIVSSTTQEGDQVDSIPVAHNSTQSLSVAVPVPTAPAASAQFLASATPALFALEIEPASLPVAVPTPLSS
jgi:hypothetical protein